MEWDMCSEWKRGVIPQWPKNPKAEFFRVYVSRMGMVMCFAESERLVNDKWFDVFVSANSGNPNLEWAAKFERSAIT